MKAPSGGILGVYSLSEDKPFKSAGFKPRDAAFAGAAKYSDCSCAPNKKPASISIGAGFGAGPFCYSERRKLRMSCFWVSLRLLNFLMTAFASDAPL